MYISIDLGGTHTRVASSKNLNEIIEIEKLKTEQNIALEKKIIEESVEKLLAGEKLEGVCVGVPGLVDKENEKFTKVVNIPAFSGISYTDLLSDVTDHDLVIAENDASLAGLGEAVLGAGRDYKVVAYLTLSTGVGGVRISNKRIDPTQNFSEPGHMIIKAGGISHPSCNQQGCLEAYVSGTAFEKIYGISPSKCEDQKIWTEYALMLSHGIINVIAMWAPDVVVLGGSLSNKFEPFFKEPLLEKLCEQEMFEIPPIKKSELADNSGLYGGFVLLDLNNVR